MNGADGRPRRVGLLVNPTAGKGRGASYGDRAHRRLRRDGHEVLDLSGTDLAAARAHAADAIAAGRVDVLCVVGGDGMAHLGAGLCAGTDVALALVAAGTGNDNARELGLPRRDPEAAAALVTCGRPRRVDLGRARWGSGDEAGERWFLGVLGAGFDSVVAERAAALRWPRGPRRYEVAIARELPRFRPIPYAVVVDGGRLETAAMLVAVGNGPAFGGGMRICPGASYDDGLLDVCVVHALSVPAFLRLFPTVFRGTHVRRRPVQVLRGRHVRLEADGIVAQADGERVAPLPLDVEVVPGALSLLGP
ncbi:diacylglycerol kinase family protein [Lapillicoccus jejuensis]|uniref:Diacylglycerol kinase n=1 Tax=Lapillicoccus jejuensis TaxID=402171 RepID=A0A542E4S7_9MICO|nr:diacylglycerol kinase family protein [Lapillicoccus jejuensis]TQJ10325.1 diacylglycerol kinase [Lapillicoccus jejuensis]